VPERARLQPKSFLNKFEQDYMNPIFGGPDGVRYRHCIPAYSTQCEIYRTDSSSDRMLSCLGIACVDAVVCISLLIDITLDYRLRTMIMALMKLIYMD
jgi:hypothetical protein